MLDEKTYADALTRRADMLYHIAKTILVSDDDCRDALQDAALRGWERRWQLRDAQLFDAWITRILINCCHAIGRKKRRYVLQEEIDLGSKPPPDRELYHALTALPEAYRLPLVLRLPFLLLLGIVPLQDTHRRAGHGVFLPCFRLLHGGAGLDVTHFAPPAWWSSGGTAPCRGAAH